KKPAFYICLLLTLIVTPLSAMRMGTNFFYLASWVNERPFISRTSIPANPWTSGFNPWNPQFLVDNQMYTCFRPMQWSAVNPQRNTNGPIASWSQRMLPDSPDNFGDNTVGTGEGPGLAYEWQIDLC